ncbi:BTB/POZ domain and ankyrin repeat-containing protein NPR2 [Citrus sinensis]|nr:BTB/POZ domain and ankyrin repeat-containing protein NPR2 [Citrus sinensis]
MENANEKAASLSFVSSYPTCWSTNQSTGPFDLDTLNLRRQSSNPEEPLLDAEIVVDGKSVAVNRSILSARSRFFHWLFHLSSDGSVSEGKPKYLMTDLVPYRKDWLLKVVREALVEDVIPILVAALQCQLYPLCSFCIQRIARSNIDNVCLEKELPDEVSSQIKSLRVKSNQESEANIKEVDPMHEKRVRRIHKALDSDDFELLNLLLNEYKVTLDDAYALHYAAAYCNPKVFKEVHNMGLADINLKDARGRTVLHVAARRKEPEVMVVLLSKGACSSETTPDGQTAVAICRRMTRRKDYIEATKQGQETNKDWLCIDVLERDMTTNSTSGNLAMSSEVIDDVFQMNLDYLENRARVAMEMAGADIAIGLSALGRKGLSGNLKEVDLNETPSKQAKRCQLRLLTLLKTVETGQRYFPHCSDVVDKFRYCNRPHCSELIDEFLDCDWSDDSLLEKGTPEEQKLKRAGFMKLRVDMQEALRKDVAYHRCSGLPSSWSAFYKYMAESNRSGMPTSSAASN